MCLKIVLNVVYPGILNSEIIVSIFKHKDEKILRPQFPEGQFFYGDSGQLVRQVRLHLMPVTILACLGLSLSSSNASFLLMCAIGSTGDGYLGS